MGADTDKQINGWIWTNICTIFRDKLSLPEGSLDYNRAKKLNWFMQTRIEKGNICSVDEIQPGVFQVTSTACEVPMPLSWNHFWMCCMTGDARDCGSTY